MEEESTAISSDDEGREHLVKRLRKELAHLTGQGGTSKRVHQNSGKNKPKSKEKGKYLGTMNRVN